MTEVCVKLGCVHAVIVGIGDYNIERLSSFGESVKSEFHVYAVTSSADS